MGLLNIFKPKKDYSDKNTVSIFSDGTNEQRAVFSSILDSNWKLLYYSTTNSTAIATDGINKQRVNVVYNLSGNGGSDTSDLDTVLKNYVTNEKLNEKINDLTLLYNEKIEDMVVWTYYPNGHNRKTINLNNNDTITGKLKDENDSVNLITITENNIVEIGDDETITNIKSKDDITINGKKLSDIYETKANIAITVSELLDKLEDFISTSKETKQSLQSSLEVPELNVGQLSITESDDHINIASSLDIDFSTKVKYDITPTTEDTTSYDEADEKSLISKRQLIEVLGNIESILDDINGEVI